MFKCQLHQVYYHNFDELGTTEGERESKAISPIIDEYVIDESDIAIQSCEDAKILERENSRMHLVDQICKVCFQITQRILFWIIYLSFTLAEPILCAHFPTVILPIFYFFISIFRIFLYRQGTIFIVQVVVLTINTLFFAIELAGTVCQ